MCHRREGFSTMPSMPAAQLLSLPRIRQARDVSALVLLSLALCWPGAQAAKLEGQRFDDTMQMADRTLQLNGLGLRGVVWIKAFVAGLYLPTVSRDANQILNMAGPKRLRLKILMEAPSEELSKAVRKGVNKNETGKAREALLGRVEQFGKAMDSIGTLHKGDVLDLDYLPAQGTILSFNGRVVGSSVAGDDFYRTVLKIFIGDKPVDQELKDGLLRGR